MREGTVCSETQNGHFEIFILTQVLIPRRDQQGPHWPRPLFLLAIDQNLTGYHWQHKAVCDFLPAKIENSQLASLRLSASYLAGPIKQFETNHMQTCV